MAELFEIKAVGRTHQLKGDDLRVLFDRAVAQGKEPKYIVHFLEAGITAEIALTNETPDGWIQ